MAAPADAGPTAPTENDRRRLGWVGLAVAATSFFAGLFTAGLLGAVYALARGLDENEAKHDFGFAVATAAGLWVGFLVLPLLWARAAPQSGREQARAAPQSGRARDYLGLTARWVDLPLGLLVGLASTLVTGLVSSAVLTRGQQDALEDKAREVIDRAQGIGPVVVLVVVLCVITPVAEEVFFRGLLFRSMQRIARPGPGPGLVAALLLGGLIFGLVHYDGGSADGIVVLVQLGMLSLFGAALCGLTASTGRVAAGIVAHATFNAVTVVSILAQR